MIRWVAETTAVTAALALLLVALGRVVRRRPASRHALWLVVLLRFVTPSVGQWPAPPPIGGAGTAAMIGTPQTEAEPVASVEANPPDRHEEPRPVDPSDDVGPRGHEEDLHPDAAQVAAAHGPLVSAPPARWPSLRTVAVGLWAAGGLALGLVSLVRLGRVCALVRGAGDAPEWLRLEAGRLAAELGLARAPRLCVCEASATPFVWCLGRPRLVLPAALVARLSERQWSGILAHELAHLRRRDHWVGWLVLGASLPWWWDPVFWLVRRRLEADAELACDAWAVGVVPDARRPLAEALVAVACGSRLAPHAPALGMSGAGRFLERRLIMILREQVPHRLTRAAALAAGMLGLLALPAWTSAQDEPKREERPRDAARERPEGRDPGPREERRREPGGDEGAKREQIEKARAEVREIEARLHKAREEMTERMRRKQEELQREVEATTKELHGQVERLMRARQELARLEGRPEPPREPEFDPFGFAPRLPGGPNPFGAGRDRPMIERRGVGIDKRAADRREAREREAAELRGHRLFETRDRPRDGGDLERRMDQLEHRFDELLHELRSQRREPSSPGPQRH